MHDISVTHSQALGQPALRILGEGGAEATVLRHGGHVVSFRPAGGEELLYLSPDATTAGGRAVRGGVPIIFPRFDERGPASPVPRHGFARTAEFELTATGGGRARLTLRDDAGTRGCFPYAFALHLDVAVSAQALRLGLRVENLGVDPFSFTCALHTYLRISDVDAVTVEGLGGRRYEDKAAGGVSAVEASEVLRIAGEVDRVYADVERLRLCDAGRAVAITQRGFEDGVVWNPGPVLAAGMGDLPDSGYRQMLCLEAARIFSPVTLQPGASFDASQVLSVGVDPTGSSPIGE